MGTTVSAIYIDELRWYDNTTNHIKQTNAEKYETVYNTNTAKYDDNDQVGL